MSGQIIVSLFVYFIHGIKNYKQRVKLYYMHFILCFMDCALGAYRYATVPTICDGFVGDYYNYYITAHLPALFGNYSVWFLPFCADYHFCRVVRDICVGVNHVSSVCELHEVPPGKSLGRGENFGGKYRQQRG